MMDERLLGDQIDCNDEKHLEVLGCTRKDKSSRPIVFLNSGKSLRKQKTTEKL